MGSEARTIMGVLAAVIALTTLDVAFDLYAGSTLRHILIEAAVILAATLALLGMGRRFAAASREALHRSRAEEARWRQDAERWQGEVRELLQGLSAAIDRQFDAWALTESEKDVALLLLKGLSQREIATVRGVQEKTVRKQCLAVYRKGGLAGRAELAAYFLEDLLAPLPPPAPREEPPPAAREAAASPPAKGPQ